MVITVSLAICSTCGQARAQYMGLLLHTSPPCTVANKPQNLSYLNPSGGRERWTEPNPKYTKSLILSDVIYMYTPSLCAWI